MTALGDARAKLAHAESRLQALNMEILDFLNSNPYALASEPHPTQIGQVLRVKINKEIPYPDWGLLLGDTIHNARSALDHLAWRMGGADAHDRDTQFPVFDDKDLFDARATRTGSRLSNRK